MSLIICIDIIKVTKRVRMKTSLIAQLLSTFAYVMLTNNSLAKASVMAGIRVNMKRNSKVI